MERAKEHRTKLDDRETALGAERWLGDDNDMKEKLFERRLPSPFPVRRLRLDELSEYDLD